MLSYCFLGNSCCITLACWLLSAFSTIAQTQCADRLTFTPVTKPNTLEWSKFPEFRLPFTLIYSGPRFQDSATAPLSHGFSHLGRFRDGESLSTSQRAIEWSGVAFGLGQPWETLLSPWNNDLNAYQSKWEQSLRDLSGGRQNPQGNYVLPADILLLDIERFLEIDTRILQLKTNPQIPDQFRQLSDAAFVAQYRKDIRALYAESIRYVRARTNSNNLRIGTYSDTPIRNTWFNIIGNSWQDWTTNPSIVNYLVKDSTGNRIGGAFYEKLDFLAPSAYYYYDFPSPLAPDYLAYLLFHIEANRAWSDKPIIPFVWMRYHDCCGSHPKFIQPFMAEATAIFPFFAGAQGLWLWELPNFQTNTSSFAAYEHFIHGLYRLSKFADMFQGHYKLILDKSARDLMDQQVPIWRGVFKNGKLLIAAQNPYANDGDKTTIPISFNNWKTTISVTGKEIYLCLFDVGYETPISDLIVFPSPTQTTSTVEFSTTNPTVTLELVNSAGQVVKKQFLKTNSNRTRFDLTVVDLPTGLYLIRISAEKAEVHKKILIIR